MYESAELRFNDQNTSRFGVAEGHGEGSGQESYSIRPLAELI